MNCQTVNCNCYSKFSKNKSDCLTCSLRDWCIEAGDPPILTYLQLNENIATTEPYEPPELTEPQKKLASFLHAFLTASPLAQRALCIRILCPHKTQTEIAAELKTTRANISKHFVKLSKKIAGLEYVLAPRARRQKVLPRGEKKAVGAPVSC